jgi:hypothetical protein
MNLQKVIFVTLSLLTAGAALAAAYYWFRSSQPTPETSAEIMASISDNEALHILDARVGVDDVRLVLMEASRLNKKASIWSGVTATLGAMAALVSVF